MFGHACLHLPAIDIPTLFAIPTRCGLLLPVLWKLVFLIVTASVIGNENVPKIIINNKINLF